MMTITDHGRGEIAFGALQAGLDIEYSRSLVGLSFHWFISCKSLAQAEGLARPPPPATALGGS